MFRDRTPSGPADDLTVLQIDTKASAFFAWLAVDSEFTLPGDAVAWRLGSTGRAEAFALGEMFLPPLGAPPERRQHSDSVRSAGAMLLALSARTPEQVAAAVERIDTRRREEFFTADSAFYVRNAYLCALLALGRDEHRQAVRDLLLVREFPQRRVLTALLASGDRDVLGWLLWNDRISAEEVLDLLVDRGLGEVLAATAPSLPTVDVGVSDDLARWQVRVLRHSYALTGGSVVTALPWRAGGP
jgi:hypothetical protein